MTTVRSETLSDRLVPMSKVLAVAIGIMTVGTLNLLGDVPVLSLVTGAVAVGVGVGGLLYVVLGLVWIHRIHQDLATLYPGYPITPGSGLFNAMVPIASLFLVWRNLTAFVETVSLNSPALAARAAHISTRFRSVFWLHLVGNAVDRAAIKAGSEALDVLGTVLTFGTLWLVAELVGNTRDVLHARARELQEQPGHSLGDLRSHLAPVGQPLD